MAAPHACTAGGFRPLAHIDTFRLARCGTPEPIINGTALPYTWRRYLTDFLQLRTSGKKFRGTGGYNNRKRFLTADLVAETVEKKRRIFTGSAWIPHALVTIDTNTACATCCKTGTMAEMTK